MCYYGGAVRGNAAVPLFCGQGETHMRSMPRLVFVTLALGLCAGLAGAHEIDAPGAVQAGGAGHFAYDIIVTITAPIEYGGSRLDGTDNTSVTTGLLPNQDLFILANNTGGTAGQFSATEVSIFLLGVADPSKLTELDDEWGDYFQSL